MNTAYCLLLKSQLDVTGDFSNFLKILAQGLKGKLGLRNVDKCPTLEISSELISGVSLKFSIKLDLEISSEKNPAEFKKLNHNFYKLMYEAKDS